MRRRADGSRATQGLYTHFEGVDRWDRLRPTSEPPPYPIDDAAVHHVFPGGWIWMLRFNNGLTSAGAALTDPVAAALGAADGAAAWSRLLATLPSVADQFRSARAVLPFVHAPRLAFRSARVSGPAWALLPSAAGVIDPLLSTGFPLTLLGILRLVDLLERTSPGRDRDAALLAYEQATLAELDATERLVAALYATMDDPPLFKRLSLLYFAAASFSEAARRLGRPELAPGFLLCAHPTFGPELAACASACGLRSSGFRTARPRGAHRPRDRTVRHGRSPRSRAAGLVSRRRCGSPGVGGEAGRHARRDTPSSGAHRHGASGGSQVTDGPSRCTSPVCLFALIQLEDCMCRAGSVSSAAPSDNAIGVHHEPSD